MAKDPNYASVGLLCHFNDFVNFYRDFSNTPKTVTPYGLATPSSAAVKFGNCSLSVGAGKYVQIADGSTYELGSGDFTISLWLNTSNIDNSNRAYVVKGAGIGYSSYAIINDISNLCFSSSSSGGSWDIANSRVIGAPSLNTWHHVEIDRSGNNWYTFLDGVQGTTWTSSASVWNNSNPVSIGIFNLDNGGYNAPACYIQELYILPGTALHTAGFTPPTAPYCPGVLAGNITESLNVTNWRVTAHRCSDGFLMGTATSGEAGTSYSIDCATLEPSVVTVEAKIDYAWSASKVVALNDYCSAINPQTTPYPFKATNIGSSPHQTGTSEPTWDTTIGNTTVSGDITFTCISALPDRPLALGPVSAS